MDDVSIFPSIPFLGNKIGQYDDPYRSKMNINLMWNGISILLKDESHKSILDITLSEFVVSLLQRPIGLKIGGFIQTLLIKSPLIPSTPLITSSITKDPLLSFDVSFNQMIYHPDFKGQVCEINVKASGFNILLYIEPFFEVYQYVIYQPLIDAFTTIIVDDDEQLPPPTRSLSTTILIPDYDLSLILPGIDIEFNNLVVTIPRDIDNPEQFIITVPSLVVSRLSSDNKIELSCNKFDVTTTYILKDRSSITHQSLLNSLSLHSIITLKKYLYINIVVSPLLLSINPSQIELLYNITNDVVTKYLPPSQTKLNDSGIPDILEHSDSESKSSLFIFNMPIILSANFKELSLELIDAYSNNRYLTPEDALDHNVRLSLVIKEFIVNSSINPHLVINSTIQSFEIKNNLYSNILHDKNRSIIKSENSILPMFSFSYSMGLEDSTPITNVALSLQGILINPTAITPELVEWLCNSLISNMIKFLIIKPKNNQNENINISDSISVSDSISHSIRHKKVPSKALSRTSSADSLHFANITTSYVITTQQLAESVILEKTKYHISISITKFQLSILDNPSLIDSPALLLQFSIYGSINYLTSLKCDLNLKDLIFYLTNSNFTINPEHDNVFISPFDLSINLSTESPIIMNIKSEKELNINISTSCVNIFKNVMKYMQIPLIMKSVTELLNKMPKTITNNTSVDSEFRVTEIFTSDKILFNISIPGIHCNVLVIGYYVQRPSVKFNMNNIVVNKNDFGYTTLSFYLSLFSYNVNVAEWEPVIEPVQFASNIYLERKQAYDTICCKITVEKSLEVNVTPSLVRLFLDLISDFTTDETHDVQTPVLELYNYYFETVKYISETQNKNLNIISEKPILFCHYVLLKQKNSESILLVWMEIFSNHKLYIYTNLDCREILFSFTITTYNGDDEKNLHIDFNNNENILSIYLLTSENYNNCIEVLKEIENIPEQVIKHKKSLTASKSMKWSVIEKNDSIQVCRLFNPFELKTLNLKVESTELDINPRKVGLSLHKIKIRDKDYEVISEIKTTKLGKAVILRSNMDIINQLTIELSVSIYNRNNDLICTKILKTNDTLYVPSECLDRGYVKFESKELGEVTRSIQYYLFLITKEKEDIDSTTEFTEVFVKGSKKNYTYGVITHKKYIDSCDQTSNIGINSIRFSPYLIIENATPEDITVLLTQKGTNEQSEYFIGGTGNEVIYTVPDLMKQKSYLLLKCLRFNDNFSTINSVSKIIPGNMKGKIEIMARDGRSIFFSFSTVTLSSGTVVITIYFDIWIINHSGMNLWCSNEQVDNEVSAILSMSKPVKIDIPTSENQPDLQINSVDYFGYPPNSSNTYFYLSICKPFAKLWSENYNPNSLSVPTEISLHTTSGITKTVLLTSKLGGSKFYNTTIVEITPKYFIWNYSNIPLIFKQIDTLDSLMLDLNESTSFYWPNPKGKLRLRCQPNDVHNKWYWSGDFGIDSMLYILRVDTVNNTAPPLYLELTTKIVNGIKILTVKNTTPDESPYIIVNDCVGYEVIAYQVGSPAYQKVIVPPLSRRGFVFYSPLNVHDIMVIISPFEHLNTQSKVEPYYCIISFDKRNEKKNIKQEGKKFNIAVDVIDLHKAIHITSSDLTVLPNYTMQMSKKTYDAMIRDRLTQLTNYYKSLSKKKKGILEYFQNEVPSTPIKTSENRFVILRIDSIIGIPEKNTGPHIIVISNGNTSINHTSGLSSTYYFVDKEFQIEDTGTIIISIYNEIVIPEKEIYHEEFNINPIVYYTPTTYDTILSPIKSSREVILSDVNIKFHLIKAGGIRSGHRIIESYLNKMEIENISKSLTIIRSEIQDLKQLHVATRTGNIKALERISRKISSKSITQEQLMLDIYICNLNISKNEGVLYACLINENECYFTNSSLTMPNTQNYINQTKGDHTFKIESCEGILINKTDAVYIYAITNDLIKQEYPLLLPGSTIILINGIVASSLTVEEIYDIFHTTNVEISINNNKVSFYTCEWNEIFSIPVDNMDNHYTIAIFQETNLRGSIFTSSNSDLIPTRSGNNTGNLYTMEGLSKPFTLSNIQKRNETDTLIGACELHFDMNHLVCINKINDDNDYINVEGVYNTKDLTQKDEELSIELQFNHFGISLIDTKPKELIYCSIDSVTSSIIISVDNNITANLRIEKMYIQDMCSSSTSNSLMYIHESPRNNVLDLCVSGKDLLSIDSIRLNIEV